MVRAGRIIFAGSPDFAVPSLRALQAQAREIVAVLTQPDRPAGRGRVLTASPVKRLALELGLPVLQPQSLKPPEVQAQLEALEADLMVVVAYGQLLPPNVLELPAHGCVNVHASLLPRWRGASPVQAAILAGDPETGVSLMQLEAGLDTGPVYATRRIAIGERETAGELLVRLAELGAGLLAEALDDILAGRARPQAQPSTGVTYAPRIQKSEATIGWTNTAVEIDRQIRAYNPWPVAETLLDGARLRCWSAVPLAGRDDDRPPGTVVGAGDAGIDVQTGAGCLRLTRVQMPGKAPMPASALAHGRPVVGKRLG